MQYGSNINVVMLLLSLICSFTELQNQIKNSLLSTIQFPAELIIKDKINQVATSFAELGHNIFVVEFWKFHVDDSFF